MNFFAIKAIYRFEMARALRTFWQSIFSPVITTSLYFIVFGAAMGSRIGDISDVSYGAFIVPGLLMMSLLGQSVSMPLLGFICRVGMGRFMRYYQHRLMQWKLCSAMSALQPLKVLFWLF